MNCHRNPQIWFIWTIMNKCILIWNWWKGDWILNVNRMTGILKKTFHNTLDLLYVISYLHSYIHISHISHFQIKLSEFKLTILSATLIPEASCNLIVLLNTTRHEYLLVLLRRLGESVSTSRNEWSWDIKLVSSLNIKRMTQEWLQEMIALATVFQPR